LPDPTESTCFCTTDGTAGVAFNPGTTTRRPPWIVSEVTVQAVECRTPRIRSENAHKRPNICFHWGMGIKPMRTNSAEARTRDFRGAEICVDPSNDPQPILLGQVSRAVAFLSEARACRASFSEGCMCIDNTDSPSSLHRHGSSAWIDDRSRYFLFRFCTRCALV
jgi:hypothetical protein